MFQPYHSNFIEQGSFEDWERFEVVDDALFSEADFINGSQFAEYRSELSNHVSTAPVDIPNAPSSFTTEPSSDGHGSWGSEPLHERGQGTITAEELYNASVHTCDVPDLNSNYSPFTSSHSWTPLESIPLQQHDFAALIGSAPSTVFRDEPRQNSPESQQLQQTDSPGLNVVYYEAQHGSSRLSAINGVGSRKNKGRGGPLTEQQRKKAAKLRLGVGACGACRKRKASCDEGTPCQSCVKYYGSELILFPCRDQRLPSLAASLCSGGVFPHQRPLASFLKGGFFLPEQTYFVRLNLGCGLSIPAEVKMVSPHDKIELYHQHVVYAWPPGAASIPPVDSLPHYIFPAILTDTSSVEATIESHLSSLVSEAQFLDSFPKFCSPLSVLGDIHEFYLSLRHMRPDLYQILHRAFVLLALVHVSGDISIETDSPGAQAIIRATYPGCAFNNPVPEPGQCRIASPTPCFIRGQLGPIFRSLATRLMSDVLTTVEKITAERYCDKFAVVIASFSVVLCTVESIQYKNAKLSLHAYYDAQTISGEESQERKKAREAHDRAVDRLLEYYRACYSGCDRSFHGLESHRGPSRLSSTPKSTPKGTPKKGRSRAGTQNSLQSPSNLPNSSFGSSYSSSLFSSSPTSSFGSPTFATGLSYKGSSTQFLEKLQNTISDCHDYLQERSGGESGYRGLMTQMASKLDVFDRLLAKLYQTPIDRACHGKH